MTDVPIQSTLRSHPPQRRVVRLSTRWAARVLVFAWLLGPSALLAVDEVFGSLPPAFERRSAELTSDPDAEAPSDVAKTAIWVRSDVPGDLQLLDAARRVLAEDRGESPVILYDWLHALKDVPDAAYFVRSVPVAGQAGTQRLLRVQAGQDVFLTLARSADRGNWQLQASARKDFGIDPAALLATVERPAHWVETVDLEQELEALLALEREGSLPLAPPAGSNAATLREDGLKLLAEGDYPGALERLERSLALEPDAALADRVARLRAYLGVRPVR